MRPLARSVAIAVAAAGVAGLVLVLLLLAGGYDAGLALSALWRGAFGSDYALLSATLVRATPLILAGLAVSTAFGAGLLNIGAEGQLLAGGAAAAAIGTVAVGGLSGVAAPIALTAGAVCGALWAGIAAALRRRFGVREVISTLMLNFVALHAVGWLVRGPLQEPQRIYPQSPSLHAGARLPMLVPGSRLHVGFALAVLCAVVLWWVRRSTALGFRWRAVGLNPFAAAASGMIAVPATTTAVFLASGGLAGLAGAVEVTGVTYALYENFSPGYGYSAIAVALLARLHPLGVIATGILFGALEAGAGAMQRDAGVPAVVATVVEAVLIFVALLVTRLRSAPSDLS